ncbi:TetR/AcrR family transcriptional regulator [Pseudodesulfovibrio sp. zrk46]|uniref:TetR/AcrR family transcriptional regulator n=1 Tax=Pseudodesulfovibrio sp. zrk46 TaxID=2725288 RepID=UPI00144A18F0|nr:TetR/AcrR family transcriptional regulator [Pseudodesulfovibrio sp. zrk46]QJB56063.1 TetR/AcrR family transcriptional regulator [Pseudodesulfovibrio sp. zrk46]
MTVKLKRRGRPGRDEEGLSAEAIVDCFRTTMLERGELPTIRQVAEKLDVDPMAIYHYFKNKAVLLEAVAVSLMESIYRPTGAREWQEELRELCRSYLALLQDHTGLLETMLSMTTIGPAEVFAERFQIVMQPLGLSDGELKNALDLLADYLHGFALAMRCNWSSEELTYDMLEGPLSLYVRGLEVEAKAA